MKRVRITLDLELADDTDQRDVAERLYDFLGDDPDDLFPEILELVNFGSSWRDGVTL